MAGAGGCDDGRRGLSDYLVGAVAALDPNGGGATGRNWLAAVSTHGCHVPAKGATGLGLLQTPVVTGYEPVNTWLEPSALAYATTACPA
jgi:hypothetical protein